MSFLSGLRLDDQRHPCFGIAIEGSLPEGDGHMDFIVTHLVTVVASHYAITKALDYVYGFMITM